ncbi:proline--tRNA ligase [Cryptosporangium sp. NPDC048952]|uniref:proline--tRNA ligase n=1 Tax=Cryptosporangium sp. NPDC048952 TaxID=3363961 RepID=UPI003710F3AC
MRWSRLYVPTLRQDPADADAVSHRLLLRAGYIRQLMAGHYTLLPLAVRVRTKIVDVIREEMSRIGAQEFSLPAMHPAEIWQKTGRWDVMGDEMFRLRDRRGADIALGMTHEEIFTTLALELRSYRDLPQMWYQFQTKFRDEPRPKSGLIRVREFTMKDAYSFDVDAAGLDTAFDAQQAAYVRIFERLGIPAVAVQASSGSMGGSASVEFMCPSTAGEDLIVRCPSCGYAANVEKATSRISPASDEAGPDAPEQFPTPGVRTIADLAEGFGAPADRQIKTLVYLLDDELTLVLMRGDHGLVEQKLLDATGARSVRPAHPEEIREALGALPGSLGAVGVSGLRILADLALQGRSNMFTGANVDEVHLRGVDISRDISVGSWADLREVVAGEPCSVCGTGLEVLRTIEVGHIFKLGYKYSEALDLTVLGADGTRVTPIMGSYGIGVERALAAVVETHNDDAGIVWPVSIAPFEVAVVIVGKDEETVAAAERLYDELQAAGVDVILDDRAERPGVKFADVELIGVPFRVTVGSRGVKAGALELTHRASGETESVALDAVTARVRELVRS